MKLTLKTGASKKEMDDIDAKLRVSKRMYTVPNGVNIKKHAGTIKLKDDPLVIQKQMREEWD